ncbi:MAG: amino acid transporter [Myxococcales bacterium]|nr:amino acid transporter [Myxococcales bacterium]
MGTGQRNLGLIGASRVGIGAIVGGGIFVLAGVAFSAAGPAAIGAFALNGLIATLTLLSFAEMATAFPESGGAYTFGKRVLSIRLAFAIGWILWLAYIVGAVLYALGFASYAVLLLKTLPIWAADAPPAWLSHRALSLGLATLATCGYAFALIRKSAGGGAVETWGKVLVFIVLVIAGLVALARTPTQEVVASLQPPLPSGVSGLLMAMGFTFIAVQGFDLIATVGGEVKDPRRTIPRAMMISLGVAMAVYLPLLFIVATVGVPAGESIESLSRAHPETMIALAAKNYMGPTGYWLVVISAIFATLSALHACLMAASRIALAMAQDRTLPYQLGKLHPERGTPTASLYATTGAALVMLFAVPDVSSAGAAASLIFLVSFAIAHVTAILARRRGGSSEPGFRTPLFPLVPVVGGLACTALALFQVIVVPAAGIVTVAGLGVGALLYFTQLSTRAEVVDARIEARDPDLVRLRGRNPLVLVPVVNPANAPGLVGMANALVVPNVGRVLILSVVDRPAEVKQGDQEAVAQAASAVVGQALSSSIASGMMPEFLLTMASDPLDEIGRVAASHRCESLLLGLNPRTTTENLKPFERLFSAVDCDVSVLAAPPGWRLDSVHSVLVPIGGRGEHDKLRARLLGSLSRLLDLKITFLRILPTEADSDDVTQAERELKYLADDKAPGIGSCEVILSDDVTTSIEERARDSDLLILGLQRPARRRRLFSSVSLRLAQASGGATIMIGRGG